MQTNCGTSVWLLGTMLTILGTFQTKYNLPDLRSPSIFRKSSVSDKDTKMLGACMKPRVESRLESCYKQIFPQDSQRAWGLHTR